MYITLVLNKYTMNEDNNTTTTADFLDLIQEETITRGPSSRPPERPVNYYNQKYYSDTESGRYAIGDRSREESDLFRVRLTQHRHERRRSDLEQDPPPMHQADQDSPYRQKMPLNGGYGGMFQASGPMKKKKPSAAYDSGWEDGTAASDASNRSSISAAVSLASKCISDKFSSNKRNITSSRTGYKRPPSELYAALPDWFIELSVRWLRLPFQLRYFIKLFSIAAVFLLASLNYFMEVDDGRPHLLETSLLDGGGVTTDRIPTMHIKKPFQYLHSDKHGNTLFEKARSKLKQSTRAGSDGPFSYGWKSMPHQIFYDSDLDGDSQTNEEDHNIQEALDVKVFPPKGTVAYVLPVTTCYNPTDDTADMQNLYPDSPNQPIDENSFRDFALMLRATAHAHSYQNPASGSMYDYKMHALVHPRARKCTDDKGNTADRLAVLKNLGYEVSVVRSPIKLDTIGSESLKVFYSEHGGKNMNNLSDLIRLNAYQLVEYDAVILVDYDTLILGSVDDAVDFLMVNDNSQNEEVAVNAVFSWKHIRSFGRPRYRASVVNLSFLVLRPSKDTYAKLIRAMNESIFSESRGWGKIGRGRFPGWMTSQGFLTYYYDEVDNARKVEMNRCTYGNPGLSSNRQVKDMDSTSVELITNAGKIQCETGQSEWENQCQDCSKSAIQDVMVADMAYCLAPWKCALSDTLSSTLCRKFQKTLVSARLQMEDMHPQLQKSDGSICIGTDYQPMRMSENV